MTGGVHKTGRRALAAVEMAIVAPLLVLLVFGLIQFSMAFHVIHNMTNAARDAARQYAVRDDTVDQAERARQAVAIAQNRLSGLHGAFTVTAAEQAAVGATGLDVIVHISVPWSDVCVGIPGIPAGQTLQSEVRMRREGT